VNFSRGLDRMRRQPAVTWAGILAYLALTIPTHDLVQGVFIAYRDVVGVRVYHVSVLLAAVALAVLILWPAVRRGGRRLWRWWVLTAVYAVGVYVLFISVSSELVHVPQYALLAIPLYALTRSACDTVALAAILGAIDEGYQYLVLHSTWTVYFDFNDVLIDAVGAALGVVWLLSVLPGRAAATKRRGAAVAWRELRRSPALGGLVAIGAAVVILLASGALVVDAVGADSDFYVPLTRGEAQEGFWAHREWAGKPFHILRPLPGSTLIILTILPFAALGTEPCNKESAAAIRRAAALITVGLLGLAGVMFVAIGG